MMTQSKTPTKTIIIRSAMICLLVIALTLSAVQSTKASGIPLIYIGTVNKDVNVTISGYNFPAGQTFTVRMGPYGSLGIGGTVVGTKDASSGAAFTATYTIPAGLVGASKIAIRFDSPEGFFSYNWFYNAPTTLPTPSTPVVTPPPGYTGIPTFNITAVSTGANVSILTNNFPAGLTFTVRMGEFGTMGVGGIVVATTDSGTGGSFARTYSIPASLASLSKIAIRMESSLGYYAYNWFYNNTAPVSTPVAPTVVPPVVVPGYTGIPTFSILSVVKDATVTISAYNFPPGQTFTVRMGEFGTLGIGGTVVMTTDSGTGGSFTKTYTIPAALAGRGKIAIRMDSSSGYYYAFNWFYNN